MASKTISLDSIPQNWFMSWTIITQAANNICVTLSDSATVYVNNVCQQSTSPSPPLSTGFQQVLGTGLSIEITIDASPEIKTSLSPYMVNKPGSNDTLAYGYNLLLEDSGDDDYNDLYLSIIAWSSKD